MLVITVDTLRADRVGAYGHPDPVTPALDRLARRSTVFEDAQATSPWTVPSLASLLTGTYPDTHRVVSGLPGDSRRQQKLPEELPLLSEALSRGGYHCYAVTTNPHLRGRFGWERGFRHYENLGGAGARGVDGAVADLPGLAEPFFLWVHFFDPHAAYQVRTPWTLQWAAALQWHRGVGAKPNAAHYRDVVAPGSPELANLKRLYESEVSATDHFIQRTLLRYRDAELVLFTSDHGEEFLDHGGFSHGGKMYDELVRIPLLLHRREEPPRLERSNASLTDLAPTIAAWAGMQPPGTWQGRNLWTRGGSGVVAALSRSVDGEVVEKRTLRRGRWKYTRVQRNGEQVGRRLYDLYTDPAERVNLVARERRVARRMARDLEAEIEEQRTLDVTTETAEVTPEELEELRALGYVDP